MAKKINPLAVAVLSLADLETYTKTAAADAFGERYTSRARAYLEMGKLVFHLETRVKLAKTETVYGILGQRGVPESTVNNAVIAKRFIENFVVPGHVSEERFDEIATFRICNEAGRILAGKTSAKMTVEEIAAVINTGAKAAIGDELDCLGEHGMTISGRKESEAKKKDEAERLAAATAAATALADQAAKNAAALEKQRLADAAATPATTITPAATEEPETLVVDGTAETSETPVETPAPVAIAPAPAPVETPAPIATPTPAKPSASSHESRPASTAEVLAKIAEVELQSYDLDAEGLQAVRAKLAEWMSLIDNTATAKVAEKAAA